MININSLEFSKLLNTNINIIDIRDKISYSKFHLNNSINIPYPGVININNHLSKNVTYYVICDEGNTSPKACHALEAKGYSVVNVLGGIKPFLPRSIFFPHKLFR